MKYEKVPTHDFDEDAVELRSSEDVDNESNDHADEVTDSLLTKSDQPATESETQKTKRSVRPLTLLAYLVCLSICIFSTLPWIVSTLTSLHRGGDHHRDCPIVKDLTLTPTHIPNFSYTKLLTLPRSLVPTRLNPNNNRKLIIIGDVHGMKDEFQHLLKKLEKKGYLSNSHVILAGDMITKGPDSIGVLDMAIEMGASCVRGNHEDSVMAHYHKYREEGGLGNDHADDGGKKVDDTKEQKDHETEQQNNPDLDARSKKQKHNKDHRKHKQKAGKLHEKRLAKALKPHHAKYIDACPLILKIDDVSGIGDMAVVHAGMIPGVDLIRQSPNVLMNIRSFVKKIPTSARNGIHWARLWNEYQNVLVRQGKKPITIAYGHDALRGLDIGKYTKGLDSNCSRGGRLSALVIRGGKHPKSEIVSVHCRKEVS